MIPWAFAFLLCCFLVILAHYLLLIHHSLIAILFMPEWNLFNSTTTAYNHYGMQVATASFIWPQNLVPRGGEPFATIIDSWSLKSWLEDMKLDVAKPPNDEDHRNTDMRKVSLRRRILPRHHCIFSFKENNKNPGCQDRKEIDIT